MRAEYYEKIVYPLQDKVINVCKDTDFYLTGGTALSRCYYHHRYSDDVDLFVNDHPEFEQMVAYVIARLHEVFKETLRVELRDSRFCRLYVGEEALKVEFVNDVPSHIGEVLRHPHLGLVDSKENILANKLTALADRVLPKDIVDLYFLLKDGLDIRKALTDAESKSAGIPPLYIAKVLREFEYNILDEAVKWVKPVSYQEIGNFLRGIADEILRSPAHKKRKR